MARGQNVAGGKRQIFRGALRTVAAHGRNTSAPQQSRTGLAHGHGIQPKALDNIHNWNGINSAAQGDALNQLTILMEDCAAEMRAKGAA